MLDIGEKGRGFMKRKIKYSDEQIEKIEIINDFLPKPEDLIFEEEKVKVTLNLNRSSLDFFKKIAKDNGSQYQKIIRNLLDSYTSHYSKQ